MGSMLCQDHATTRTYGQKLEKRENQCYVPSELGMGIARDWKVVGSNPCRSGRRIFFSSVDFLCWLLFRYPFHPLVTAVACKKSQSFCQKCRWQVTTKHAYTWHMWLCMKCMLVWWTQNLHQDGCSFMWHQPCQRCTYTTSVDFFFLKCYKKLVTHVEPHMSAVSLLKRVQNSAI